MLSRQWRQHCRLCICSCFGWVWQILGLSTAVVSRHQMMDGKSPRKKWKCFEKSKKKLEKKVRKIAEEKVASTAVAGWRDQGREGKVASCLIQGSYLVSYLVSYKALYLVSYLISYKALIISCLIQGSLLPNKCIVWLTTLPFPCFSVAYSKVIPKYQE